MSDIEIPVKSTRRRSRSQRLIDESIKLKSSFQKKFGGMPVNVQKQCEAYLNRIGKIDTQLQTEFNKQQMKRRRKSGTSTNRPKDVGITKPYNISNPLILSLFGKTEPTQIRQPQMTSAFWDYIKTAKLPSEVVVDEAGNPELDASGRKLYAQRADDTLAALFGIAPGTLIHHRKAQRLITNLLVTNNNM